MTDVPTYILRQTLSAAEPGSDRWKSAMVRLMQRDPVVRRAVRDIAPTPAPLRAKMVAKRLIRKVKRG